MKKDAVERDDNLTDPDVEIGYNLIVLLAMHGDPHGKPDLKLSAALSEVVRTVHAQATAAGQERCAKIRERLDLQGAKESRDPDWFYALAHFAREIRKVDP